MKITEVFKLEELAEKQKDSRVFGSLEVTNHILMIGFCSEREFGLKKDEFVYTKENSIVHHTTFNWAPYSSIVN